MISYTDNNIKFDPLSFGILALYVLHSEFDDGNNKYLFGLIPKKSDHGTPRPPSRASLVVSPWLVVGDDVSVATSADDGGSETDSIIVEEVEGVDVDNTRSPTPPPTIWGRFLKRS